MLLADYKSSTFENMHLIGAIEMYKGAASAFENMHLIGAMEMYILI